MQAAPERAVERANERRARKREHTARQVERLRERVRVARASSSAVGATDGVDQLAKALNEKEAELETTPLALSKQEASQIRAAAVAQLRAAEELAATVASVQVRRNNVVFWKR